MERHDSGAVSFNAQEYQELLDAADAVCVRLVCQGHAKLDPWWLADDVRQLLCGREVKEKKSE